MKPNSALLVLLALILAGAEATAQCPGGTLAFRIIDIRNGDVRPRVFDLPGSRVESMALAGMRIELSTIERDLELSLDSGYYPGGPPVFQSRNRGGFRQAFLSIDRGSERMEISITNVAPGDCFLLDSIPFRSCYWEIDLEPARRDRHGMRRIDVASHLKELKVGNMRVEERVDPPISTEGNDED